MLSIGKLVTRLDVMQHAKTMLFRSNMILLLLKNARSLALTLLAILTTRVDLLVDHYSTSVVSIGTVTTVLGNLKFLLTISFLVFCKICHHILVFSALA